MSESVKVEMLVRSKGLRKGSVVEVSAKRAKELVANRNARFIPVVEDEKPKKG